MGSVSDGFSYAMYELKERLEPLAAADLSICNHFTDFVYGFEFLSLFVDCIQNWSNALEVAPHLGNIVVKIESALCIIEGQFVEEVKVYKRTSEEVKVSNMLPARSFDKKASKWISFFEQWNAKIDALKPEIAEACDNSNNNSVKCSSPSLNFHQWEKFCQRKIFEVNDQVPSRRIRLDEGPWFFEVLGNYNLKNPKIEAFLVKVGCSIISAGMLSCRWWANNFDPNVKRDVEAAFGDLGQKLGFTNPEFIDIILGEQAMGKSYTIAKIIRNRLLPSPYIYEEIFALLKYSRSELKYMLTTVLDIPKEDALLQIFLPDIKQLVMEIASLRHLLFDVNDSNVMFKDIVPKVCLIMVELYLRTKLVDNVVTSEIYALKKVAYDIEESFDGSESNKFSDQIFMLVKEVATDLERYKTSVSWTATPGSPSDKPVIDKEALRLRLLLKTLIIKGELLFLKLRDKLLDSFKELIETLHIWFKIIILFVIKYEKRLKFSEVELVASKIISLYHRILDQDISESEDMFQSMIRSVSDVVNDANVVTKNLEKIYLAENSLRFGNSDFPKTNAAGFIYSLLRKLQDLLSYGMNLVESVITKEQITEIMGHLQFFQTFLCGDISMEDSNHGGARLINICYEAEYLFDSAIDGKEDEWHSVIWMYDLIQEMRKIKIQISSTQSMISNKSVKNPIISRTTTPKIDEGFVELVDQEEMLINQLLGGFKKLFTVSIVGMPGIGKTTLAKIVYNSPQVVPRFSIRAWCCVSEIYRKRDVLLEILSHIIALTGDITGMINEDLEFELYKILKTGRYLIVLDDVWDTDVLDDLIRRFPDNGDESRILITSRHNNVALKANPDADPHYIRQLSDSESWELLQMKIFREKPCPEEFKEIGMQIAGSCKGLPLAIIAIAGLLERIEMQHHQWKDIAESLNSKIIDDPQEPWRHILELSYENLPDCLKACFLYFGAFLEDQDIPARKLIQLWIAEGFVLEDEFKTMEDVAEDYLMDLIGRSLVIISKHRSRGSVDGAKACRIHDVLRKLCQSKAKEDKFMQVITRSNASNNALLHDFDDFDYLFSSKLRKLLSYVVSYEDHRICLCSKLKHFINSSPSAPHVRSLLCIATVEEDLSDTSFIYRNFRFLKVLDLECINIGNSFPQDILLLLHLRYLAVFGKIESVPDSIANLRNLETFILKGFRDKVTLLPLTIFSLKKLRHVCVSDFATIKFPKDLSQLHYLVTISSLFLPFGKETDYILMQFPNLRKLKCIFSESHQFPNLKVLNQLESLKVTYYGVEVSSRGEFGFTSNLKKLTLTNFRLPWEKISAIGRLPNLEVLKLLFRAFVGEEWEMAEGEFVGLKYLKLENLDVSKWNANGDCLPKLQQLVLRSCNNLEIPVDIVEVSTLRIIDVQWCGDSAEKSARRIREDGDEMLKVFINFAELPFSNC